MGSIIKGSCRVCGYKTKNLYYGGGFVNFTTCCDYPVLDKDKKEVGMANIMDKEKVLEQNPNLQFYDDETLSDNKSQNQDIFHEWGDYKVYSQGYLCPKCNKFTLGFSPIGNWD
jgi:hypothetical protein